MSKVERLEFAFVSLLMLLGWLSIQFNPFPFFPLKVCAGETLVPQIGLCSNSTHVSAVRSVIVLFLVPVLF